MTENKPNVERLCLKDIITTEELAEHLHLSVRTVRRYLRDRVLPGQRVGSRWFVERLTLLSFLRQGTPLEGL